MTVAAEILAILAREGYHVNADETAGITHLPLVALAVAKGEWVPNPVGGVSWKSDPSDYLAYRIELPGHFFAPGRPEIDQ